MLIFNEKVDDEKYIEIVLSHKDIMQLSKSGIVSSKVEFEGEVINLGIIIDNFDKECKDKI